MPVFERNQDEPTVNRVLAGQREEFAVLVERYQTVVHSYAYAHTCNTDDAEDVTQETFLKAFQHLGSLRDRSRFDAWLLSIAHNCAVSLLRARQRPPSTPQVEIEILPSQELERRELREILRQQITRLDANDREILMLHYFGGRSTRQLAHLLSLGHEAAKKRLQRARYTLHKHMLAEIGEAMRADEPDEVRTKRIMGIVATTPSPATSVAASAGGLTAIALNFGGIVLMKQILWGTAVVALLVVAIWSNHQRRNQPVLRFDESGSVVVGPAKSEVVPTALPTPQPAAAGETSAMESAAPGVSITGLVIDPTGQGVAGADVYVDQRSDTSGQGFVRAQTSEHGAFCLGNLKPTRQIHLVAATEDAISEIFGPRILPEEGLVDIVLELRPTGSISGSVLHESGAPAPGLSVEATIGATGSALLDHLLSVRHNAAAITNTEGRFCLAGLPSSSYSLKVNSLDHSRFYGAGNEPVDVHFGEQIKDLVIVIKDPSDLAISGRVTDVQGKPLRANVLWSYETGDAGGGVDAGEDGRFTIDDLSPGRYLLNVCCDRHQQVDCHNVTAGTEDLDIVMTETGVVFGTVVAGDTGKPVPQFDIALDPGRRWTTPALFRAFAGNTPEHIDDPQGKFRLNDMPSGENVIFVRAQGFADRVEIVSAPPNAPEIGPVVIRLPRDVVVRGLVHDTKGVPIEGATIFRGILPTESHQSRAALARTEADGTFVANGLELGQQRLVVKHEDYATAIADVSLNTSVNSPVDITLTQGGRIEGHILYDGIAPRSNSGSVRATLSTDANDINAVSIGGMMLDDGMYRIERVPKGAALVNVWISNAKFSQEGKGNASIQLVQAAVVNEKGTTHVDFDETSGTATVEGRIVRNGRPGELIYADLTVATGAGPRSFRANADPDGMYRFVGIPLGDAAMTCVAQSSRSFSERVVAFRIGDGETVKQDVNITD